MKTLRIRIKRFQPATRQALTRSVVTGAFFCFLVLGARPAESIVPPLGYRISSISTVEYFVGPTRFIETSNQVFTTVGPYYRVRLTPQGTVASPAYSLAGVEGDTLFCGFVVENIGNARDSITVFSALIPPSTVGIDEVLLFYDSDRDSIFDPGEDDPSFLVLDPGESTELSVQVALAEGGGGESYIELQATAGNDTVQNTETSVFRVTTRAGPDSTLHFGPAANARALPRGDGTRDDVTRRLVGFETRSVVFENDILNEDRWPDIVEIEPADSAGWPAGVTVTITDTSGAPLQNSPRNHGAVLVGPLNEGETRTVQVRVSAEPRVFYDILSDSLSLRLRARSALDSTRINETIDRVVLGTAFNPAAVLSIDQTFKENRASFADIVTLIVSVTNMSDSLTVADVVVDEFIEPALDFLSSPDFEHVEDGSAGQLIWHVGSLAPKEKKQAAIKLTVNSRVSKGETRVVGNTHGMALSRTVSAGPVSNVLVINNDLFSDEGFVFGDVFVDTNVNGKRDPGDTGIPGVGVFIESGEYALTDSTGRYSLPYVFSGYRVIRVDESTLPPEVEVVPPGAGESSFFSTERLIHLVPAGHAKVTFPFREKPAVEAQVLRQVRCQEMIAVQTRWQGLFQMPSIKSSNFEIGKAYLKTETLGGLDPILDFLARNPGWMVFLEGHTDSVPIHNDEFPSNEQLSIARAGAVQRYLSAKGIDDQRIVIRGYGAAKPLATNSTRDGRARNRRVEVSFVPPGVGLSDRAELDRIQADMGDIDAIVDTVEVLVVWSISTDSPNPMDVDLALEIPEMLADRNISVTCNGAKVSRTEDYRYRIAGFAKSRAIECEMRFATARADTQRVRDIRSTIEILNGVYAAPDPSSTTAMGPRAANGHPGDTAWSRSSSRPTYNPIASPVDSVAAAAGAAPRVVVLSPFGNGDSSKETQFFTLFSWKEASAPARVEEGTGDTGPLLPGEGDGTAGAPGVDATDAPQKSVGLIEPSDGTVVSKRDQIEVAARVPLGSTYTLFCNDVPVSEKNIGKKQIYLKERYEEIWYYAVKIENGWNDIRLYAEPVDGSEAIADSITVALSGKPTVLEAAPPRILIPADGQLGGTVWITLKDHLGLPAVNGLVATIVEGDSLVANVDEDAAQRGLQVTSQDGRFAIQLKPRTRTGRERVVVEAHDLETWFLVAYVPTQRPMLLTGMLEGRIGLFNATGNGSGLGLDDYYDGVEAKGNTRFFVQGTTYAGINLTARIDSKKRYADPIMKQIDPERQYSIYGDASQLQFSAPAQGGNYIALEKDQSFVRYGDFRSPLVQGEFLSYKRTATGLNGALVSGNNGINGFVTKTDYVTVRDELDADGTSGYYYLEHSPIVENSLNLFLETRDRFRPELIVDVKPLVEHRDYTVNYFNGALLFKEPVPAFTQELNPVRIVVIYETEASDENSYLYGLRGNLVGSARYKVGATAVAKDGGASDYALYGIDGGFALGPVDFSGEVARSEDDLIGDGNAYKFQVGTKKLMGEHSVYIRQVDGGFVNPSFTGGRFNRFRQKAGFDSHLKFSRQLSLLSSGFAHEVTTTGDRESSIDAVARYEGSTLMLGAGARAASETVDASDVNSLLSVLQAGIRLGSYLEFRTHWEQNLRDEVVTQFPNRLISQLKIPVRNRYKIVVTHEHLSGGPRPATEQLLAGVETNLGRFSKVYSKYAMNRTASDQRMGAIAGLRQQVPLGGGLMGTLDIEGLHSFSDRTEDEYVAVKAGLSRLDRGKSLLEGYYEYRWQSVASRHLFRGNALKQFDNGMAIFFKNALSFAFPDGRQTSIRNEGRIAGAYRPDQSPIHSLFMLKTEYDRYSPIDPEAIVWKTVLSTDVNVMPVPLHEFRFKFAIKYVEDYSLGISSTSDGHLVLGQYVYRFAKNWDVDLWGRYVAQGARGTRQFGSGVELGRTFYSRVRIAGGYSLGGFEDRDLAESDAWSNGFGVRIQLILSDWMFDGYQF
ncbi:MAG: OmpA family protein [Candidatus Latescibacterota bacterium]|nr:MAG: OmpA family protein [Candidatus Latescibacterota bacterium]